ncbi:hypothetical protein MH215_10345 [Paenibacillus sp. ACRSA]|uniref:hypothetical protein n=1 Tax=Paenibacillus sp. ACRSA TaxID=2918211 RepID=UPI001EF3FD5F|nr:hypothetical protein [Paenibacillus sp. ACRSA]MCG7377395.1 hypothetical protein [Paenibacillus sp. ACRSA]
MSLNKILGAGIALSVLLSANPASANPLEDRIKDTYTNPPITVENPDDPIITPLDLQIIRPDSYSSYNAYERYFTLTPENGEDANLWIQNTSTDTIYAKVTVGSLSPLDVPIAKGKQSNIRLGVIGTTSVKVYVYSSTGHKVEMNISARQF